MDSISTNDQPFSDRWDRIQTVFHAATERPQSEWEAVVEEMCGDDLEMAAEVRSLLTAHDRTGLLSDVDEDPPPSPPLPQRIGPYHMLRQLGEGGMGTVYLAERREADFTQRVALKLIRSGLYDPRIEERLRSERRILASLEHPGIARLIDGGTTETGQPYLAMEYVDGATLMDYADDKQLSLHDRIRLFLEICDVVQYAHRQLVVHRDLKPSNILVTEDGRPKLLDFGIAKLVVPTAAGTLTQTAPWLTPAYASPEQVRGETVGTLSDVYALGVLLYELLAGSRPYVFSTSSPTELQHVVGEVDPAPPSSCIGDLAGADEDVVDLYTAAEARRTTPERLRRQLRGDLDAIVLRALAKDPESRYGSAEQLAQDLRHHLSGQTVAARPNTLRYRTTRFVKRHRSLTVATGLLVLSLLGGLVATAWQASVATREAAAAQEAADQAAQVTGLMVDLFQLSDPSTALGDTVTAREILDRGTDRIERDFVGQPDIQAAVFSEVAAVYSNLGLLPRAERLLRRSLELKTELYGPQSLEVSSTLIHLGQLLATRGERGEAIFALRRGLEIRTERLPAADTIAGEAQYHLAWELRAQGDHEEAASLFRAALSTRRELLGPGDPLVANATVGLAATLHDQGLFDDAEELLQQALDGYDVQSGQPSPVAASALQNIGMLRRLREQYREAEPILRSALEMRRAMFDADHPDVLETASELTALLIALGRFDEAEQVGREALTHAVAVLSPEHALIGTLRQNLSNIASALGRYAESNARLDTAVLVKRRRYGGDHPDLSFTLLFSAEPLLLAGRYDDAATRFTEADRMLDRLSGSGSRGVGRMLVRRGQAQLALRQGNSARAQALIDETLSIADEQLRVGHRYTLAAKRVYADIQLVRGAPAAGLLPMLEEVLAFERATRPSPHPNIAETLVLIGRVRDATGDPAGARSAYREALTQFEALPARHPTLRETRRLLTATAAPEESQIR